MPDNHHFSVGGDDRVSAGVHQRWLTLWESELSDQPALLDAAFNTFTRKFRRMTHGSHDGLSADEGSGRLPQG